MNMDNGDLVHPGHKAGDGAPRRQADRSNMRARAAIAATLQQFGPWRSHLAVFNTSADRPASEDERDRMLEHCAQIEHELREARTNLLIGLAEAPQPVAGHSRVVDVEKALDNIEAAIADVRRRLGSDGR